jgi:hypothetical protein
MIKMVFRLAFFILGAGAGIWYANKFPMQGASISAAEDAKVKQAVAAAQTSLIQQFVNDAKTMVPASAPTPGSGFVGGGGGTNPLAEKWQQKLNQVSAQ